MANQSAFILPKEVWFSELQRNWGWIMAIGILLTVLGFVGLGMAFAVTIATVFFFGILLLGGTVSHVVQMFRVFGWGNMLVQGLLALLYLAAAVIIFYDPVAASISLTFVIAAFLLTAGILRIVVGIGARPLPGWGWVLTSGIVDVLLAIVLFTGWPVTGLWFIGLMISLDLLFAGIGLIILSMQLHRSPSLAA